MKYCYRCPECGPFDIEARMGKAPEALECDTCGGTCERDFAAEGGKVNSAYQSAGNNYPYVSHRLPRHLEGCSCDKSGKPVITSRRHEMEVAARHGYTRD